MENYRIVKRLCEMPIGDGHGLYIEVRENSTNKTGIVFLNNNLIKYWNSQNEADDRFISVDELNLNFTIVDFYAD